MDVKVRYLSELRMLITLAIDTPFGLCVLQIPPQPPPAEDSTCEHHDNAQSYQRCPVRQRGIVYLAEVHAKDASDERQRNVDEGQRGNDRATSGLKNACLGVLAAQRAYQKLKSFS